jgi:putative membrane protein
MKRLLTAAFAASLLGACHFHSRAWLAQHANDKAPPKPVADTQPVVRQAGEPAPAPAPAPARTPARTSVQQTDAEMGTGSASEAMSRSSFFFSDARSVGRFLMANDVDISFAKIALANAGSDEVKAFARRMLTDHTQIIANARALASDQEITPADDDAGRDLRDFSTLERDSLRALSGRAFDVTYVAMELERHRAMLSMIDDVLLPRVSNSELQELLASTRPIIAAHVAHAEQLQATLARR